MMGKLIVRYAAALVAAFCFGAAGAAGVANPNNFVNSNGGAAVSRTLQQRAADAIHVRDFVTAGSGTQGAPWTGWDSRITWAAGKTYVFTDGWYSTASSLPWRKRGITIRGQSSLGTVVKFTGTGDIVSMDGTAGGATGVDGYGANISDLRFVGSAAATNCFMLKNVHHIVIRNVRCNDFTGSGIVTYWAIHGLVEDFVVGVNEGVWNISPTCGTGVRLIGDAVNGFTGSFTFVNTIIGTCSGYGFEIGEVSAANNVFINGAAESNIGGCMRMNSGGQGNKVHGFYCNNSMVDNGAANQYHGLTGGGSFSITSGAMNTVSGGLFDVITVGASARDNSFIGVTYGYGGGVFTDSGTRTQKMAVKTWHAAASVYDNNDLRGKVVARGGVDVPGGMPLSVQASGAGRATVGEISLDGTWSGINLHGSTLSFAEANMFSSSTNTNLYFNRPTGKNVFFYENFSANDFTLVSGAGPQWGGGAEPTCDSTSRGTVVMVKAAAGVKDTFRVCAKDAANAYAWRTIY